MVLNTLSSFACSVFFFNDTSTTEIYTLSLHDALPIWVLGAVVALGGELVADKLPVTPSRLTPGPDRKSTRLNSSHANISYAVFCLKKKKKKKTNYLNQQINNKQPKKK